MSRDWNELISAYLDGELDPAEREEFEQRLESGDVSRTEFEEMKAMRGLTGSVQLRAFPDHEWDRYWAKTYNRMERNLGWIFLSLGAIVLVSAGLYELLRELVLDGASPWWLRAATGSAALGMGVLFVSVLRERLFVRKTDPYRGDRAMILVTTNDVAGREITEVLGLVRGSTIRARHIGRDILARMRGIVGGEVSEYTKLMGESREQALDRLVQEARELGADAVVGLRFTTSEVMDSAAEILVYGTAVKLR